MENILFRRCELSLSRSELLYMKYKTYICVHSDYSASIRILSKFDIRLLVFGTRVLNNSFPSFSFYHLLLFLCFCMVKVDCFCACNFTP